MSKYTSVCLSLLIALTTPVLARADESHFSEIRLGAVAHDPGIFGHGKESGTDISGEIYFRDLDWLDGTWDVRPSVGVAISTQGDTSQIFTGLNIGGPVAGPVFLEFGAGAAVHDGELTSTDPHKKELGSRVLFHLSASAGVMVSDTVSLSIYLDHASNANLSSPNEGLETLGGRVGLRF